VSATAAVAILTAEANCFLQSTIQPPYLGHCGLRLLVYGEAIDKLDEYFQIAESTAAEYLIDFYMKTY
jgi:hypothetical protein